MAEINLLAVLAATFAAFISGATYYALLGGKLAQVSEAAAQAGQPPPWKLAVEVLRGLVVARSSPGRPCKPRSTWRGGLLLGLALWIGFPLVLSTGAVIHRTRPRSSPPSMPATGS